MPAKTAPTEDVWHGVQDRKKRKQIQDRLAQRARRKRLAEEGKSKKPSDPTAELQGQYESNGPGDLNSLAPQGTELQLVRANNSLQPEVFQQLGESLFNDHTDDPENETAIVPINLLPSTDPYKIVPKLLDYHLTPTPNNSACLTALMRNGSSLGMKCSVLPSKSLPQSPEVPISLQPSKLQLETVHPLWIDRFPFIRFRDNYLRLSPYFNAEEFLDDFFTMKTFSLAPGSVTWDPSSWYIHKDYYAKWGWLFFLPPDRDETHT